MTVDDDPAIKAIKAIRANLDRWEEETRAKTKADLREALQPGWFIVGFLIAIGAILIVLWLTT